ncbi:bifunctional 3-(3-hydroxy-phenyl)propionate/3-hydroxycinnamic acid hydroxylase [Antarcticimicrobium luteum]|jgi:3-(3-hydroxy-phenyl)propionate hydroxylase|uniref:Bifunctional 3-(3-hydroxy-phenyl)propionate/3-hydroxycinnamic acid hydroxylase n=1 Tax=Antarcticimicrobium luteum TaxID=2547397 RepID=A0A4R5VEZ6_9RHOB|nr:bifunctional 3-(3-hydroxy-phenyl)propionate/3-hydroxycinnamic acid hydroxylase [Antarcticimicrobium luteum]TDK50985.1 bifunctional 3-(3-hydroxy-phenyl)propionate/3-hydroxycinnamic acid hydroxylase [Antarcticimicrobium luteum]
MTNETINTDVAIVGAGPVGTLLAILLGQRGKRVTLVERWGTHYELPRAVTYDHEIARILATLGMDSENDPAISYHDELYYWKNKDRENLQIVDWQSQSASGWRVRYWFNQPMMEKRFLAIAATMPSVEIVRGWVGEALEQDSDGVTLTIKRNPEETDSGETKVIRAQYLAGTDGANSFVRNSLGIENEDKGYFFDWLILDMIMKYDYVAERSHEPAQWQLCDPSRPTTIVPGGPGPDPEGPARRRWEYMLLPGESVEEMTTETKAWELLANWGVTPENAELERSAVYRFQARWAKEWNKGRCVIGGDAAHLMPPFAGEGMCAGVRDAVAMAWRLNGILEGKYGPEVLDSYTSERVEHAKHYINFSQELGQIICIHDEEEGAKRDAMMMEDLKARGGTPVPTDLCHLGKGAWCDESAHAGELSVQGIVEANGKRDRFDQAVGQGWILFGYETDPAAALTEAQRAQLEQIEGFTVELCGPGGGCEVVDVEGTFKAWLDDIDAKYVLIRPDFYVALTANNAETLQSRFDKVMAELHLASQTAVAAE